MTHDYLVRPLMQDVSLIPVVFKSLFQAHLQAHNAHVHQNGIFLSPT